MISSSLKRRFIKNKETDATPEIKECILDCSSWKAMEANKEHMDQIYLHVGNVFGRYVDNVKCVIKNLEDPDVKEPNVITDL